MLKSFRVVFAHNANTGQSVAEYGLVIAAITVVSVAAMSLFGNNIADLFQAQGFNSKPAVAPSTVAAAAPSLAITAPGSASTPSASSSSSLNVQNGTGQALILSEYPTDVKQQIVVSGANGTTQILANTLTRVIQNALSEGKISPDQANQLTKMANIGYQMSAVEKLVEGAVSTSNGDTSAFMNTQLSYNGSTYSPSSLVQQIQLIGTAPNIYPSSSSSLNGQFYQIMQSAVPKISDPNTKTMIGVLSNQILAIGDSLENTVSEITYRGSNVGNVNSKNIAINAFASWEDPSNGTYPTAMPSSLITSANSGKICSAGGHKNQGESCQ